MPKTKQAKSMEHLKILILQTSKCWQSMILEIVDKTGAGNPDDPSNKILRILDMRSTSTRKHEMEIWQYGGNIFQKP